MQQPASKLSANEKVMLKDFLYIVFFYTGLQKFEQKTPIKEIDIHFLRLI